MKNFKNILVAGVSATLLLIAGCAKDGATGPAGAAGTNGTNGNANVRVFFYQNDSMSSLQHFSKHLHIKSSIVDSSLVLAYYAPGNGSWYESPGIGQTGQYSTRSYYDAHTGLDSVEFDIVPLKVDGSAYTGATVYLQTVKIIVVPGSTFNKTSPVDYSDYHATMKYFGLKD